MNRGRGGYQRGGRGARGGRRGNRRYSGSSGSSGSSSGQNGLNRPILRPTSTPPGRVTPPEQRTRDPARFDLPVTPIKEKSSFTLNGHPISQTYTPRGVSAYTPPRSDASPSSPTKGSYPDVTPSRQGNIQKLITKDEKNDWAYQQEYKIRIMGVPRSYRISEVHKAMSRYGNVVRIEIANDNNAWVTFQPPPLQDVSRQVHLMSFLLRSERVSPRVRTVLSPVNPEKEYYELNIIFANSVEFGTRDAQMSMIGMHTVEAHGRVQLMLNLDRRELDVQFPMEVGGEMRKFRFRLPITFLSHIYKGVARVPGQTALTIPFDSPPQFYVQKHEGEEMIGGGKHTSFSTKDNVWNDWNTWFRETDVVASSLRRRLQEKPLLNHRESAIIDIGRWTSYRLCLNDDVFTRPQFKEFASALADHGVEIKNCNDYMVKDSTVSPLWSLLQDEIAGTHPHLEPSSTESGFDGLFGGQIHLPFQVRYQLEACLSNGYLKEHNITKDFLEKLASLNPRQAIHILEKVVDKQQVYYDPMEIFHIQIKGSLDKKIPSYCILQRSATVTPTMIHVASPIMDTSNRITRKYAADADRFIRIRFSDEKTEGVLRNMPNDRAVAVFDRVRRAMRNGIIVAGRYYEFLAFGNSQFREHGAYFYAPTSSKSADDIRLSLGQFDHIKTVAKFGARLGQCFSTTRAMELNVRIVKMADVEHKSYCFTDGVGKLSLFLAQMAAEELKLPNAFDDPPSLFQFRLGGCKGVLALDPKVTGSEVHIRPSQQKFKAEFRGLEIIRSSSLATPFFNRQIITVLSNLGVNNNVFIRKQQDMVNDYEQAMTDEETAIRKLRKHIDMNQTTLTMAQMVLDGFMTIREPFIMSLLKLWRASTIRNLKEKARIAIDDGAFVLGCVDETATLKGHLNDPQSRLEATRNEKLETLPEIFLQVDDTTSNNKGHYKIVKGICVLARNPSLHPGDLRIVRAVDVPALHHLKNVVVFPQTGDRDLANMCSGGDLDGDDYMVLWDEDLLPEIINVPPMDFTPEKPIEKTEPITVADIIDFFVTYMQNDSLGQIAHAHLAQADFHTDGVMDETCLELAKLHSQAVDYPKSGIPAKMACELRPKRWPHYMEKKYLHQSKIYKSTKILGMLYDQVQLVDFKPQWENPFDERILNAFTPDEAMLEKAAEIKESYDESMKRLMAKHGIQTEFEAWSVFVLAHNHESRDYKFAEEFGRTVGALKAQYKEACREAANVSEANCSRLDLFVAAMYTVTAREMEAALAKHHTVKSEGGQGVPARLMDPEYMPLLSFPWLFASDLGKIATRSNSTRRVETPHIQVTHRKKHLDVIKDPKVYVGTIETEEGVTHYGELLKLDFGAQPTSKSAVSQQTVGTRDFSKSSGGDGNLMRIERGGNMSRPPIAAPLQPLVRRSASLSSPVVESYGWKRDAKKAAYHSEVEDSESVSTTIPTIPPKESIGHTSFHKDEPQEQENSDTELRIEKKKPSALDRLMDLGLG